MCLTGCSEIMLGINAKRISEKIPPQSFNFCYFPFDKYIGTIVVVMKAYTKAVVTEVYRPVN